jgi:hypothetical protein
LFSKDSLLFSQIYCGKISKPAQQAIIQSRCGKLSLKDTGFLATKNTGL